MSKIFNISADCKENLHYMVNIENRLWEKILFTVFKADY